MHGPGSSAVEQTVVFRLVDGSNPFPEAALSESVMSISSKVQSSWPIAGLGLAIIATLAWLAALLWLATLIIF